MIDPIEIYANNKAAKATIAAEYAKSAQIAQRLLAMNLSVQDIAKATALSEAEVETLKAKLTA